MLHLDVESDGFTNGVAGVEMLRIVERKPHAACSPHAVCGDGFFNNKRHMKAVPPGEFYVLARDGSETLLGIQHGPPICEGFV
jgi:hypothetical protein